MPDAASKTASAGDEPYKIKGKDASKATENQLMQVSKYPCCWVMLRILLLLAKNKESPINKEIIEDVIKYDQLVCV